MRNIRVLPGPAELARAAAEQVAEAARQAADRRGRFLWVLAGGGTPLDLYRLLAGPDWDQRLPWEVTHLFWGDERCLPPEHPHRNHGAALEALGPRARQLGPRLHPMPGGLGLEPGAKAYEAELKRFFVGPGPPVFDLVLLGLGTDGHLASLFPGSPALEESQAWVAGVEAPAKAHPPVPRLTLTLPVINAARLALVLVVGAAKAPAAEALLDPRRSPPPDWPASRLAARRVVWMLDRQAASHLPPER